MQLDNNLHFIINNKSYKPFVTMLSSYNTLLYYFMHNKM